MPRAVTVIPVHYRRHQAPRRTTMPQSPEQDQGGGAVSLWSILQVSVAEGGEKGMNLQRNRRAAPGGRALIGVLYPVRHPIADGESTSTIAGNKPSVLRPERGVPPSSSLPQLFPPEQRTPYEQRKERSFSPAPTIRTLLEARKGYTPVPPQAKGLGSRIRPNLTY